MRLDIPTVTAHRSFLFMWVGSTSDGLHFGRQVRRCLFGFFGRVRAFVYRNNESFPYHLYSSLVIIEGKLLSLFFSHKREDNVYKWFACSLISVCKCSVSKVHIGQ